MQEAIEYLKKEFQNIRTDRATPALVEDILVDYYGTKVTLKETASISAPESRLLIIQPWDKDSIVDIEKALIAKNFTPKNDGQVIRVSLPALTDERKKELEKEIGRKTEQARIKIRLQRDKQREKIKELKDEDERYRQLKKLDEDVEKINEQIEKIKQNKIKELCS
ncbi:MAG: ribosome-recycling factor [bacterium]